MASATLAAGEMRRGVRIGVAAGMALSQEAQRAEYSLGSMLSLFGPMYCHGCAQTTLAGASEPGNDWGAGNTDSTRSLFGPMYCSGCAQTTLAGASEPRNGPAMTSMASAQAAQVSASEEEERYAARAWWWELKQLLRARAGREGFGVAATVLGDVRSC